MIQYKNGIFCEFCKALVDVPLQNDFFQCLNCNNKLSINDFESKQFYEEKIYKEKKPWLEVYLSRNLQKTENQQNLETIEQECVNKNCDSNLCYYTARQMRSADEGQTVFYKCVKCGEKFTLNNQLIYLISNSSTKESLFPFSSLLLIILTSSIILNFIFFYFNLYSSSSL